MTSVDIELARSVANVLKTADTRRITIGGLGLQTPNGRYGVSMDNLFLASNKHTGVVMWFASKEDYETAYKEGNRIADFVVDMQVFPTASAATEYLLQLASG